MKITKTQLKQIIKEELEAINEKEGTGNLERAKKDYEESVKMFMDAGLSSPLRGMKGYNPKSLAAKHVLTTIKLYDENPEASIAHMTLGVPDNLKLSREEAVQFWEWVKQTYGRQFSSSDLGLRGE
jgi:hypothetical protein